MFTIKGCSLIRGVHYERFHCISSLLSDLNFRILAAATNVPTLINCSVFVMYYSDIMRFVVYFVAY